MIFHNDSQQEAGEEVLLSSIQGKGMEQNGAHLNSFPPHFFAVKLDNFSDSSEVCIKDRIIETGNLKGQLLLHPLKLEAIEGSPDTPK